MPSFFAMRSMMIWLVNAVTTLTSGCAAWMALTVASIVFARVSLNVVPKLMTTMASLFASF